MITVAHSNDNILFAHRCNTVFQSKKRMNETLKKIIVYSALFLFLSSLLMVDRSNTAKTINKALGLSFFPLWLVFSRRLIVLNRELVLYFCFIAWCLVTIAFNGGSWDYAYVHLKTMIQLGILMVLVTGILYEERDLNGLAFAIIGFFLVAYIGSWFGLEASTDQGQIKRMQGVTTNPNVLGFTTIYGLLAVLYLIEKNQFYGIGTFFKWNWWIPFAFFAALILPTGSRKSLITVFILLFGYALLKSTRNRTFIAITSILFILASYFLYDSLVIYVQQTAMGERLFVRETLESGASIRLSLYQQGWNIFWEHPIMGVGLNNFQRFSDTGHEAHSYYIELLAGSGIVGFMIIASVYFSLLRKSLRLFKRNCMNAETMMALGFLMSTFVMGFGYSHHRSIDHWIILAVIVAVISQPKPNSLHRADFAEQLSSRASINH